MEFIKEWGQIAGIAGLAMGAFLFLFREVIRKEIFVSLTKKQSFIIIIIFMALVWSISGYSIYTYQKTKSTDLKKTGSHNEKEYKSLNRSFLLGIESAAALGLSSKGENVETRIIKINEWLRELDINYKINSKNFDEQNVQSIINFFDPKGEPMKYSYLLGFYSFVCDNTPEICHKQFDLSTWYLKSELGKTKYTGNTVNLKNFLNEMKIHSEKMLK